MNWTLIAIACVFLTIGCKSAPKSARAINAASSRALLLLISEYSQDHGRMPPNIYVLDMSHTRTGDRQSTIADLRAVTQDRKYEADFLYFWSSGALEDLAPEKIVLASPFAGTTSEGRWVLRANGEGESLNEFEFRRALNYKVNNGKVGASAGDQSSN